MSALLCRDCGHSEDDHDGYGGLCDGLGFNGSRMICGCRGYAAPAPDAPAARPPVVTLSWGEYESLRRALDEATARAVRCEGELDEIKTGVRAIADRLWNLDYREARELSVLLRDAT